MAALRDHSQAAYCCVVFVGELAVHIHLLPVAAPMTDSPHPFDDDIDDANDPPAFDLAVDQGIIAQAAPPPSSKIIQ
jgi:hypothetical protein